MLAFFCKSVLQTHCVIAEQAALARVEALLCEQPGGSKCIAGRVDPRGPGLQLLRVLLHLQQVALHAWKALCVLQNKQRTLNCSPTER